MVQILTLNVLETSDKSFHLWISFPSSVKWKHWIRQAIHFLVLACIVSEMAKRRAGKENKRPGRGHMIDILMPPWLAVSRTREINLPAGIIWNWTETTYFLARTRSYFISNIAVPLKAKFELVIMQKSQGIITIGSQVNQKVNQFNCFQDHFLY